MEFKSQAENPAHVGFEGIRELWIDPIWPHETALLAFWSQRCVCLSAFFSWEIVAQFGLQHKCPLYGVLFLINV